jgi:O-antigen ligase
MPEQNPKSINWLPPRYRAHRVKIASTGEAFRSQESIYIARLFRLLAIVPIAIFFVLVWGLPVSALQELDITWYMVLGLALAAWLFQGAGLNPKGLRIIIIVAGLGVAGAFLSAFNAEDPSLALYNAVAMVINMLAYTLFIPTLAKPGIRKVLLGIMLILAVVWTAEIQILVRQHSYLVYSTFAETGENKNHIGFLLTLSISASFFLAVFIQPFPAHRRFANLVVRLGFAAASIFFFYNQTLIYARAGIASSAIGIASTVALYYFRNHRQLRSIIVTVLLIAGLGLAIFWLLPKITLIAPQWIRMYEQQFIEGQDLTLNRQILIEKALFLISQNPIFGIGIGGSRAAVTSFERFFPGYLIHNLYLTDWVEKGLLGLIANIAWVILYLNLMRKHLLNSPILDQLWMVLLIPLFFYLNFKDFNTISYTFLAILAGLDYERSAQSQAHSQKAVHDFTSARG